MNHIILDSIGKKQLTTVISLCISLNFITGQCPSIMLKSAEKFQSYSVVFWSEFQKYPKKNDLRMLKISWSMHNYYGITLWDNHKGNCYATKRKKGIFLINNQKTFCQ